MPVRKSGRFSLYRSGSLIHATPCFVSTTFAMQTLHPNALTDFDKFSMLTIMHILLSPLMKVTRKWSCPLPTFPLVRLRSFSLSQQFSNYILAKPFTIPKRSNSNLFPFHTPTLLRLASSLSSWSLRHRYYSSYCISVFICTMCTEAGKTSIEQYHT